MVEPPNMPSGEQDSDSGEPTSEQDPDSREHLDGSWQGDPSGRHQLRFRTVDGNWTDHVADGGTVARDPMPEVSVSTAADAKPKKPVWRRWWMIALYVLVPAIGCSVIYAGVTSPDFDEEGVSSGFDDDHEAENGTTTRAVTTTHPPTTTLPATTTTRPRTACRAGMMLHPGDGCSHGNFSLWIDEAGAAILGRHTGEIGIDASDIESDINDNIQIEIGEFEIDIGSISTEEWYLDSFMMREFHVIRDGPSWTLERPSDNDQSSLETATTSTSSIPDAQVGPAVVSAITACEATESPVVSDLLVSVTIRGLLEATRTVSDVRVVGIFTDRPAESRLTSLGLEDPFMEMHYHKKIGSVAFDDLRADEDKIFSIDGPVHVYSRRGWTASQPQNLRCEITVEWEE